MTKPTAQTAQKHLGFNMPATIRLAKASELRAIQDLNYELFKSDAQSDPKLFLNWPYEEGGRYFRDKIAGRVGVCFVAELDGKVVGYLAGAIHQKTPGYHGIKQAELENMFVSEAYRSHGVGSQLIDAFKQWCKDRHVQRLLVAAFAPNDRAIAFYQKNGFRPYVAKLEQEL